MTIREDFNKKLDGVFKDLNVKITSTGTKHLQATFGKHNLKKDTTVKRSASGSNELQAICKIAKSEPKAPFTCFISGYKMCIRPKPNVSKTMQKVDDLLKSKFLPAIN